MASGTPAAARNKWSQSADCHTVSETTVMGTVRATERPSSQAEPVRKPPAEVEPLFVVQAEDLGLFAVTDCPFDSSKSLYNIDLWLAVVRRAGPDTLMGEIRCPVRMWNLDKDHESGLLDAPVPADGWPPRGAAY